MKIMQRGYKEHFRFNEKFLLSCQILDFALWIKSTVVEFSKGQMDMIFLRSVLRVYLSFGMLHIPVSIHEGSTPPLPNRVPLLIYVLFTQSVSTRPNAMDVLWRSFRCINIFRKRWQPVSTKCTLFWKIFRYFRKRWQKQLRLKAHLS